MQPPAPTKGGKAQLNDEFVSEAVEGDDVFWPGGIVFYFLTQFEDEVVDRAGAQGLIISPDIFQQLIATDRLVAVLPEKFQQLKFFRRHLEILAAFAGGVRFEIKLDRTQCHLFRRTGRCAFHTP